MTPSSKQLTRDPVLYTVQEIAALLHIHPQSVRIYHRNGDLEFVKVGKRHLTSAGQLDKFITEHTRHRGD